MERIKVFDVFGNEELKLAMWMVGFPPAETWCGFLSRLPFAVIIMLAPIFSGEYEGVDNIILTSKYGKTKCATAKVVAGIITAVSHYHTSCSI